MSFFGASAWYTDMMDIYRVTASVNGNITEHTRTLMYSSVPCRIYAPSKDSPIMTDKAAVNRGAEKVACAVDVDICEGDEILITRGGALGKTGAQERFFAGHPVKFYDPVGGALTRLEHQEIGLMADNIIGGTT